MEKMSRTTWAPAGRVAAMEAAFFDLDKTVIARASMVAFGRPFQRAGLVSRWLLLKGLYGQIVYLYLGADESRMTRMRDTALRLTKGWHQAHVQAVVAEALEEVVEPIVFEEALTLIRRHQAEGRLVFIVSASPDEIVAPLARYLGADRYLATRTRLDAAGRYSGEVDFYCYGENKAAALRALASDEGIDLDRSYAYSDSVTDLPMLECVGLPHAVNADRDLARVARERGWSNLSFEHRVRLARRVTLPAAPNLAAGMTVAAALTAGVVGVWWWLRRASLPAAATADGPDG